MRTSVIIIGQGLCGTWLSYYLYKAGVDFLVIDEERPNSSTRVASGVINPVTGRRMVKTWLADEAIPFAEKSYKDLAGLLNASLKNVPSAPAIELIKRCGVIDFFNAPDRRMEFEKRAAQFAEYLVWPTDEQQFNEHFNYDLGFGIVSPAYQVDLQTMLDGWRSFLKQQHLLVEEKFEAEHLRLQENGLTVKDVVADRIVFCDGVAAHDAGFFRLLPFAPNKGEALIVKIDGLPNDHLYKKGSTLTPWRGGLFWAGSSYSREFTHANPTPEFRQQMEKWLRSFLKHPFEVVDHLAAVRPATVERRPFAGWHPLHRQVGILNGTGTKGVTLAPYFASELANNITTKHDLMPEVDVTSFSRILSR